MKIGIKKRILLTVQAIFLLVLLCSCASNNHKIEDYKLTMKYHDDFRILQLTDIHLGLSTDLEYEFDHLTKVINSVDNIDLIAITGDSFLLANKPIVRSLIKFIDSFDIPWIYNFGNHDNQGFYDSYYINRQIMKAKNALFIDYAHDSIDGYQNYYVNLVDDGGNTIYRIYNIDSNSYHFKGPKYGYEVITDSQLEHLKAINSYENDNAPGIMFYHIPVVEATEAYEGLENGTYEGKGENREPNCPGYKQNGAYEVFKEIGIIAAFSGHDHINYSAINYKGEMILSYGVKATDLVYYDKDIMGAQVITLPSNSANFNLDSIEWVWVPYEN